MHVCVCVFVCALSLWHPVLCECTRVGLEREVATGPFRLGKATKSFNAVGNSVRLFHWMYSSMQQGLR